MNIILLSGGSGRRLWPLSNEIRAKQFIKVYKTKDGHYESMVQRLYRQLVAANPDAKITIATTRRQVPLLRAQLNPQVAVSVEPDRRDTFPAIALAAAFLRDRQHVSESEAVVVCPADHYVGEAYFKALRRLADLAQTGDTHLSLMGIQPTGPSDKYGYILPQSQETVSPVKAFREKPDAETARGYLKQNALWNCGVFAFKLGYLLRKLEALVGFSDYDTVFAQYDRLEKTSFDYAVVEREPSIQVMRYPHQWDDVGSWAAFAASMPEPVVGKAVLDDACSGVTVVNETQIPVLCMGLRDMVVAVSGDGILVSDMERSGRIKPYVEAMKPADPQGVAVTVLDQAEGSAVEKLTLSPGSVMEYTCGSGVLTVLSGRGVLWAGDQQHTLAPGFAVALTPGCRHRLLADTPLTMIRVQFGDAGEKTCFTSSKNGYSIT